MQSSFQFLRSVPKILNGEKGIIGLETAILLIAFVVVSSVFDFSALSTGMFSSDKARETVTAGLAQTRASMQLKGSIIGTANAASATGTLTTISFHVSQTSGGADVDLTSGTTMITYTDEFQSKLFSSTTGMTVTPVGASDSDKLLEANEIYKIELINLDTGSARYQRRHLKIGLGGSNDLHFGGRARQRRRAAHRADNPGVNGNNQLPGLTAGRMAVVAKDLVA